MQQSSTTQSLHLSFWGLRKIVACSHFSLQYLLVSTVFGTVSSLQPTSFLRNNYCCPSYIRLSLHTFRFLTLIWYPSIRFMTHEYKTSVKTVNSKM